jgi:signal transduction histidine kinase
VTVRDPGAYRWPVPEEQIVETGLSTTLLLSLAAVAAALLTLTGEEGAFQPLTLVGALAGLVPWALVAGGVRVPPWLFLVLAVPPGVLIVSAGNNPGGMFPLILVIVWLTLTSRSMWLPALAAAASFLAIVECTLEKGSLDESGIVYFTGGIGIGWLSGWLLRRQAALTAQVAAMRDIQVQQVAATERARIAREVHDVVAHSLTVVMLNLTGARRALATDPARADEALARAEVVGRDSLDSIRQVMGLLHDPDSGRPLPQPTLEGIPQLVGGYGHAGLVVDLRMTATRVLDPSVELVAYRVVQESLANVLQHAPGAAAAVVLADDGEGVQLTVTNGPATGGPSPTTGRVGLGTRGMGERVRAVGGTFDAVATRSGGWLVSAWLPADRPGAASAAPGERAGRHGEVPAAVRHA